ncbi:hypothetical protein JOC61_001533 [Marinitoga litoralis]|nr:hypothetical protein [Marinitoga litoralis]
MNYNFILINYYKEKDDNMNDKKAFDKMTNKQRNEFLLEKIEKNEILNEEEGKALERYLNTVDWDNNYKVKVEDENPEFKLGEEVNLLTSHYIKRKYLENFKFKNVESYNTLIKETLKNGDVYGIIDKDRFKEGDVAVLDVIKVYIAEEIKEYFEIVPKESNLIVKINVLFGIIKTAYIKEEKRLDKMIKREVLLWKRK